jgi:hypothetical protein
MSAHAYEGLAAFAGNDQGPGLVAMTTVSYLPSVSLPSWGACVAGIGACIWEAGGRRSGRCWVSLDISEEALTLAALDEHAAIPIAFVADRILAVTLVDGGLGGMSLTETAVASAYVKDYDAIEGEGPTCWPGALTSRTGGSSAPAGMARRWVVP